MANDVMEVQVFGSLAGEPVLNVLHYQSDSMLADDDIIDGLNDFVTTFQTFFQTPWLGLLPDDYMLIGYKARRVNNGGSPHVSLAVGEPGATGFGCETSAIGPCIVWPFNDGENWLSGKTFVPGVYEGGLNGNVFSEDIIAAVETLIEALFVDLACALAEYVFAVFQRATGLAFPITTGTLSGKPGVQRRRLLPTF
jgi:hypothetical protein